MYVGCCSFGHSILDVKSELKKESRKLAVINFQFSFFCALGESREGGDILLHEPKLNEYGR
jgi:hypothetical protein